MFLSLKKIKKGGKRKKRKKERGASMKRKGLKTMTKARNLSIAEENPSRAKHHHPSLNRDFATKRARIYACGQWPKNKAKPPQQQLKQNITENKKRIT